MFFCAISGEAPQEPVVSTKSGNVYERRLIIKYITENGTAITGDKLEESDLVASSNKSMYVAVIPTCILKISLSHSFSAPKTAAPRPPTHTSIPGLLHLLQNEWDALVLGTHALEQKYNATRQELKFSGCSE
jgi:pre-mRNA-processing factor 19